MERQTSYSTPPSQGVHGIARRLAAFCAGHWDLNALWMLRRDVREVIAQSGKYTPKEITQALHAIDDIIGGCLQTTRLPDKDQSIRLLLLADELEEMAPGPEPAAAPARVVAELPAGTTARFETPPSAFWRHWAGDAGPPELPAGPESQAVNTATPVPARMTEMNDPIPTDAVTGAPDAGAKGHRIYHLTEYGPLSMEIDHQLEREGYNLELLDNEDELDELLQALPADLILIDPGFASKVDRLLDILGKFRAGNAQHKLAAIQILDMDADGVSGIDRYAGMDAVISRSTDARGVVNRVDQLLRFGKTDQYRVLIVEDDRSQAMFAEGILRNAEITTKVLLESDNLLDNITEFKPDLVLMDLNMPQRSGIELTEMIRQTREFQNIPIIVLSGETDEERQLLSIEAGGDDFLSKPIRPRRLIAAVQNRIKRHRAMIAEIAAQNANPGTGLLLRAQMMDLLKQRMGRPSHALFFIEINGINLLKDRIGLSALESLLKKFASFVAHCCDPGPVARFGDSSFVMLYEGDCSDAALTARAERLRQQIMSQKFDLQGQSIEFRVQIGICTFDFAQNNTDILINAAERIARTARSQPSGVAVYKPQSSAESLREDALIKLLAGAAEGGGLSHVYQPIVAVAGGEEKRYQTLLRLTDEEGKLISAVEFIPLAEKNGMITTLDRWSLAKAADTIGEHQEDGDEIKLFVNQASATLTDPGQLNWLKNLLKASSLPSNSLVIEINHNDALMNQKSIGDFCQALIYDGIQFCLSRYNPRSDDSNLLDSMPVSYIKLAPGLTAGLLQEGIRDQIKGVIDFAHRNGIEVIAHGVEDAHSAATLWMSGIDFIQGNLVQPVTGKLEFGFDQSVL